MDDREHKEREVAMGTERQSRTFDADDESAVRAVVVEFANTWNRHDMHAMHELDTEDVEWINVSGHHWRGKEAVYKGHDMIHRTVCAKTGLSIEHVVTRALSPDVAVVVTTMLFGPSVIPSGQEVLETKTRGSFIVVRQDGIWKIAHFQNTSVDAEAEHNDPVTWDSRGFVPGGYDS